MKRAVKKNLLISLCFVCMAMSYTWAQSHPEGDTSLSQKKTRKIYTSFFVAASVNWLANLPKEFHRRGAGVSWIPAWNIDIRLGKSSFFFGTGLSYNTLGGNLLFDNEYVNQHENIGFSSDKAMLRTYKISYIDLPAYVKYKSPYWKNWNFYADLGLNIGFKVKATAYDVYENFRYVLADRSMIDGRLVRQTGIDSKISFMNMDAGVNVSAGYRLGKNSALLMGLGYRYGFIDILNKNHEYANGVSAKANTQQFLIKLGFIF